MAIIDTHKERIEEGSGSGPDKSLTDAEKDWNEFVLAWIQLQRSIKCDKGFVTRINQAFDRAPGGKVGVMAHFGSDKAEAEEIFSKLIAKVNGHKSLKGGDDPDNPVPWPDMNI